LPIKGISNRNLMDVDEDDEQIHKNPQEEYQLFKGLILWNRKIEGKESKSTHHSIF